ncbi:unnamed protein product [Calicophoron daubneyi]|uniref:Uncharacterized protein n=1 Tax=Calicophoron daubneyi TaxID=300641 RepID=A0AAV2T8X9_CALDB
MISDPSRSTESRAVEAIVVVSERLGSRFKSVLGDCCAKVRRADPEWFDCLVDEATSELHRTCSTQLNDILQRYRLSAKAVLLENANENLCADSPWQPSRNPEFDIRAHILSVKESHLRKLSDGVESLRSELRPLLDELKGRKAAAREQFLRLQLMANEIHKLSNMLESTDNCCSANIKPASLLCATEKST